MPRFRITIESPDREAMLDLVRVHKIPVYDHGVQRTSSGDYAVQASASAADIAKLKAAGYSVEKHEDIEARGKKRQKEVGKGDRYRRPDRAE
jgi:hypothetical protein